MSAETRVVVIDDHEVLRTDSATCWSRTTSKLWAAQAVPNEASRDLSRRNDRTSSSSTCSLEEHDGIELIRELSRKRIQVIAYSDYRDDRLIARSLNAGALGFAVKDDDTDGTDRKHPHRRGRTPLARRADLATTRSATWCLADQPSLSRREREILGLLSDGFSTDEVAEKLSLSAHTVRTHVKNAMRKLDASTRAHAVAIALRDLSIR